MIQANELRIGNIHKSTPFDIPREGIRSDRVNGECWASITAHGIYLVDTGQISFEPILLTEDWLLRMGFTQLISEGIKFDEYSLGNITLAGISGDLHRYQLMLYGHCLLIYVDYVHTLQNLYFALTGEELKYGNRTNR